MSRKKNVAIIGTAGLPANYGGFETLTDYLTKQKNREYDFTVFCGRTPKESQLKEYNGVRLRYLPLKANGSQSILYDVISIVLSWFKYDVLIILGSGGCFILPLLRIFKKTKTIVNFGGLEWKRDKWHPFILKYLRFTESAAIKNATHIVADNQYFCDYIFETYGKRSELIEYGGDHVSKLPITNDLIEKYPFLQGNYAISVSRAQSDNNLHLLLEAYSKMPEHVLVLISNWDKFEYGKNLKKQYSNYANIFIVDAIYDLKVLDVLRSNAHFYIHSHTYCGTAPSLVEAMNLGLPIVSFRANTNFETTENQALFFTTSDELISLISNISEESLKNLGEKMKEIALRRYTWERISNEYALLF